MDSFGAGIGKNHLHYLIGKGSEVSLNWQWLQENMRMCDSRWFRSIPRPKQIRTGKLNVARDSNAGDPLLPGVIIFARRISNRIRCRGNFRTGPELHYSGNIVLSASFHSLWSGTYLSGHKKWDIQEKVSLDSNWV